MTEKIQLKRWNWGAFFLPLVWGMAHRSFLLAITPFLVFIACTIPPLGDFGFFQVFPYFYFAGIHLLFGFKGNEWAWQKIRWSDVAQFRKNQRFWALGGLLIWTLFIGMFIAISAFISNTEIFYKSLYVATNNQEIKKQLGEPITSSLFPFVNVTFIFPLKGDFEIRDDKGSAAYSFKIVGSKNQAEVAVAAIRRDNKWTIKQEKAYIPNVSSAQKEIDIVVDGRQK